MLIRMLVEMPEGAARNGEPERGAEREAIAAGADGERHGQEAGEHSCPGGDRRE